LQKEFVCAWIPACHDYSAFGLNDEASQFSA
jgi:hypothetical protein